MLIFSHCIYTHEFKDIDRTSNIKQRWRQRHHEKPVYLHLLDLHWFNYSSTSSEMDQVKKDVDDIQTPDPSRSNSISEADDDDNDPDRRIPTSLSNTDDSNRIQSSSPSSNSPISYQDFPINWTFLFLLLEIPSNDPDEPDASKSKSFLPSSSSESENDFALVNQNDYPSLRTLPIDGVSERCW